jgi:hypothetical protein
MFTRTPRIGRYLYTEALESYRDPVTGLPKHRCVARWRAERTLAEEMGRARFRIANATKNIAYWQGVIDRTVRPNFWKHVRRAPDSVKHCRASLATETARHAQLMAVHAVLPADSGEIDRAAETERAKWDAIGASFRAFTQPRPPTDQLAALAERIRAIAAQNDPDAVRAGLAEIAAELDALAGVEPQAMAAE